MKLFFALKYTPVCMASVTSYNIKLSIITIRSVLQKPKLLINVDGYMRGLSCLVLYFSTVFQIFIISAYLGAIL